MSNVFQSILIRLYKPTIDLSKYSINYSTRSKQIISLELLTHPSKTFIYSNQRFRLFYSNVRFLSNDSIKKDEDKVKEDENGTTEQQQSQESSSTHQQYHRQKYERQRSQHTKNNSKTTPEANWISDLTTQMNHYQRLNVDLDASSNTIKSAYYKLSKVYHPDIVGDSNMAAVENFRAITEAYNILSDTEQRRIYDIELNRFKRPSYDADPREWSNSKSNSSFKVVFRSKDADSLFRFKQDSQIDLDKMKNPKKYQAGAFKETKLDPQQLDEKLDRLSRQLNSLEKNNKNGNSFYQQHLSDTIRRRRADLSAHRNLFHENYKTKLESDSDGTILFVSLSILLLVVIGVLNIFNDFDAALYLDTKLRGSTGEISNNEAEVRDKV